jgi:hypothetical protein
MWWKLEEVLVGGAGARDVEFVHVGSDVGEQFDERVDRDVDRHPDGNVDVSDGWRHGLRGGVGVDAAQRRSGRHA